MNVRACHYTCILLYISVQFEIINLINPNKVLNTELGVHCCRQLWREQCGRVRVAGVTLEGSVWQGPVWQGSVWQLHLTQDHLHTLALF